MTGYLADALAHSDPGYHCGEGEGCTFLGRTLLSKIRMGNEDGDEEDIQEEEDDSEEDDDEDGPNETDSNYGANTSKDNVDVDHDENDNMKNGVELTLRSMAWRLGGDKLAFDLEFINLLIDNKEISDMAMLYEALEKSNDKTNAEIAGENLLGLLKLEKQKSSFEKLREEIQPALKTTLQIVLEDEEVSEEMVTKLTENDEIVSTCQRWKISQDASETEKLFYLITKHLGHDKLEAGDHKAAINLLTDSLEYQPQDKEALYSRATCYYAIEKFFFCIQVTLCLCICQTTHHYFQDCEEIISLDHTMVKPLLLKADALQKLGKVKEAQDVFSIGLTMEPDSEHAREGVKTCKEMIEED